MTGPPPSGTPGGEKEVARGASHGWHDAARRLARRLRGALGVAEKTGAVAQMQGCTDGGKDPPVERVAIKKTYVLWGQNDGELEHRIDTLRQAIGEQEGSIIDIEWVALPAQHGASASILYEVPLRRGVRRGRVGCSPTAAGE